MSSARQLPFDFTIRNEFTFPTFIVGQADLELLERVKNLRESREHFYFIWGETGVGKTHLLQAVCHANESSVYIPLSRFVQHSPDILQGLEELDVVCLDEIEAVLGKRRWEEKLFELFNGMRERGNTLLISASSAPRGLGAGMPDLLSRLSWGVIYQLNALEDSDKARALQVRAELRGIDLNDEALSYILQRSARGMKSLFEVLDRLDQSSLMEKRRLTIPFIREIMEW